MKKDVNLLIFWHFAVFTNIIFYIPFSLVTFLILFLTFGLRDTTSNWWNSFYTILFFLICIIPFAAAWYIKMSYLPKYIDNFLKKWPDNKYSRYIIALKLQNKKESFLKRMTLADTFAIFLMVIILVIFFKSEILYTLSAILICQLMSAGGLHTVYEQVL